MNALRKDLIIEFPQDTDMDLDQLIIDIPQQTYKCFIYKVPPELRKVNHDAYTPMLISIGPFHHKDEKLKNMEELKLRYFRVIIKLSDPHGEQVTWSIILLKNFHLFKIVS